LRKFDITLISLPYEPEG